MTTTNINNAGWFYHAPSKPKPREDIALPPTSQIPGLSEFPDNYFPPDEPRKMLHKDTDSKYVTLAKQGGRADLLRMHSPKAQQREAVPYHIHAQWFYLEDNRKEDEAQKLQEMQQPYHPGLPDYMVHNEYNPRGTNTEVHPLSRNPLSRDTTTVFQREGQNATNKTMKITEPRPSGYGIRGEKQKSRPQQMPVMPKVQRGKAPESELDQGRARVRTMKVAKEESPTVMQKVLSHGYQREWESEHDKWQKQQQEMMKKQHDSVMHPTKQDKCMSEYQSQMALNGPQRTPQHGRRATSGSSTASHRRQKAKQEQEPPAIFNLPQYKQPDVEPMKYNPAKNLSSLNAAH